MSCAQAVQGVKVTRVCEWPGFLHASCGPQRDVCKAPVRGRLHQAGASFYLFFFFLKKGTWNLKNVNLKQMAGDIQLLFEGSPGWGDALPHQNCHSCCSVAQSCPILCYSMDCSTPGFPVYHRLPKPAQTHVSDAIGSVTPSNHFILCCPLLLLPSILPSIRDFSNESALHIMWPKYQLQHQSFQWIFRVDFL